MKFAVGLTTVPERRTDLLPRTVASLEAAGFPAEDMRLFIDGSLYADHWLVRERTCHGPERVRAYGNWILGLWELYLRQPAADVYCMFQDDLVCSLWLRNYLSATCYQPIRNHFPGPHCAGLPGGKISSLPGARAFNPEWKVYYNLYTFPSNQDQCPRDQATGRQGEGWYASNQLGRGAVGLVFSRQAVQELLCSPHVVLRVVDCHRGHKAIDGAVVTALREKGYTELVHNPSLLQHTGTAVSSIGNKPHQQAPSFRGEGYSLKQLLAGGGGAGGEVEAAQEGR